MVIKKENAMKLQYLWEDRHDVEWIGAFIKIVNKDTKTVPFILTQEQRKFLDNLEKFNIVLKSRQLGLSVCTVALSIRQCIVYPNSCCLLVSHDQKSCNAIFDKLKQQFNSLPKWLKPKEIANNRQEIKMANGSKITCCCAGNKDVGRGDTLHLVHLSEFAFWKMPEKQLNSITQALAPDGKLIIESTANGLNYFHNLYFQAKNNENSYKSFFFNWISGSALFKKDYDNAVEIYKSKNNKLLTVDELDEEELILKDMGATMEQLMWRKLKVASGGLDAFHQEYPSTDIEAFISTGSNVFNNKRIDEIERAIKSNKITYIKKENIIDLPNVLKNHYGRSFFIWKIPKSGERYYIGIDASEGVEQDYTVIEVFDKEGEQVAEFYNNKLKPYEMAEIANAIGRYFNKGIITCETASGGGSIIERLRYTTYKYLNMTKYKSYDQFNKIVWRVGFDTNALTKGLVVNDLREAFETGKIKINSTRLLNEMKVYENKDGKYGASGSNHDDSVMATALALQGIKNTFYYTF